MFNNDTNLIFEAYHQHSIQEGKMKDIMTAIEAGEDVDEIISSCNLNDTEEVRAMVTSARDDYYEKGEKSEEDNESREKNIMRGKEVASTEQEMFYKEYGGDAFEDHYGFRYPKEGEENEESSEGAVNLLEQLKQEMPELEDKVNQILEKVFDAVDVLKQESYVNDPELRKAHDSLIEGDF
jgi:hypothetical protein